jgi:parvulin-like peptidyl-prolyl isomerase
MLNLHGQDFIVNVSPLVLRRESAGGIALNQLINERLLIEWAEKTKSLPSQEELQAELKTVKEQPDVRLILNRGTLTEEQLLYNIKIQLTRFRIATVAVSLDVGEAEAFYKKNIANYSVPERWGLSVIRTMSEARRDTVQKALKAGQEFAEVAKQYSEERTTGTRGGEMGVINAKGSGLPEAVVSAIKEINIGEVTPPIRLEVGKAGQTAKVPAWVFFRLTSRNPEEILPFEKVQKMVERDALLTKAGGYAVTDKKIAEFRYGAKIEVLLHGFGELSNP